VENGILMLFHLLDCLNTSCPEYRLIDIRNLVIIGQGSTEDIAEYIARVRAFDTRLHNVTFGKVMNIFCLLGMTDDRYGSIISRYAM